MAAQSLLSANLFSSNSKSANLSLPLLPKQFVKSTFSCKSSALSVSFGKGERHESGFVRRVAVTSEYEKDEEVSNVGGGGEMVKASQPGKAKIAKELKKKKLITGTRMNVNPYDILKYPLTTEHALKILEQDSTIIFIVDKRADKKMIRAAVEKMYGVKTKKINTLVRPQGDKKAFIMCDPEVAKKISIF